jgi:hypothetical protein
MWIGEFVGSRDCVLLFDPAEEAEMVHIPSGAELDAVLRNISVFEFYVTDREARYLICFNHHDVLIGCGLAETWLKERLGSG